MEFLRALKPTKIFLGLLYPTVFSLRVDFHCRVIFTCVKFTFASKIEAINAWKIARKRKSCTSRNFTYKLITLYLASILFTQLKFSCVFTLVKSTRKWKPTLTLKLKPFCFGELKWILRYITCYIYSIVTDKTYTLQMLVALVVLAFGDYSSAFTALWCASISRKVT